jgi:hypothetical protein
MRIPYRLVGGFKGLLFVAAVAIIAGVMLYTDRTVSELRESSRRHLTLKIERFKMLFLKGDDAELDLYLQEMAAKDFPLIVADSAGNPMSWSGLPDLERLPNELAQARARSYQHEWVGQGNPPVMLEIPEYGLKYYYYYGDSNQIRRLRMMPWVEVAVVGGLVLIGYLGFVSIKKSEERSVWVGMARETAHQLGTPLSSLLGWVELLNERPDDPELRREIVRDLERLRIVADRFNRIGSRAPLERQKLRPIVENAVAYISRRLPQSLENKVATEIRLADNLEAPVDKTLLVWVLENLLKNGVEALKGEGGTITVTGAQRGRRISLDVADDGCGIPRQEWRNIFRPGYTTKERGWGLGLSLARRIITDVHGGKIFVLNSSPDEGTTIRVQLSV